MTLFAENRMQLESTVLNEVSQPRKDKCSSFFSLSRGPYTETLMSQRGPGSPSFIQENPTVVNWAYAQLP